MRHDLISNYNTTDKSNEIEVGDRVLVMGKLTTTIIKIEGDSHYFKDEDGRVWQETKDLIEILEKHK